MWLLIEGVAYVAGGFRVALREQGVSPGELGRVEWLTWVLRDPVSKRWQEGRQV